MRQLVRSRRRVCAVTRTGAHLRPPSLVRTGDHGHTLDRVPQGVQARRGLSSRTREGYALCSNPHSSSAADPGAGAVRWDPGGDRADSPDLRTRRGGESVATRVEWVAPNNARHWGPRPGEGCSFGDLTRFRSRASARCPIQASARRLPDWQRIRSSVALPTQSSKAFGPQRVAFRVERRANSKVGYPVIRSASHRRAGRYVASLPECRPSNSSKCTLAFRTRIARKARRRATAPRSR